MKTTTEEVKALVWALAAELNARLPHPKIKPDQQQKTLKNISLVRHTEKPERFCIRPSKYGFYIAPSQQGLVVRMEPFLEKLIGEKCYGYYQPAHREPYWYVSDFGTVRQAAYFFAQLQYPPNLPVQLIDLQKDFEKRLRKSEQDSSKNRLDRIAQAHTQPTEVMVTSRAFNRNPDVVAEALYRANGICESCGLPAPFLKKLDSTPYLEIHHIQRLADGGADVLENVQALCPNCHRRSHYGIS